jgi:hypothetical protein
MDPPRDDGRRCLDAEEMRELDWVLDKRGRWTDPASARRVRAHHAGVPLERASDAVEATGGVGEARVTFQRSGRSYEAILAEKRHSSKRRTA